MHPAGRHTARALVGRPGLRGAGLRGQTLAAGGASLEPREVQRQQRRGFAENLKDIQTRINSTKNIQKITKSMKMVAAAKLRGDQDRLERGRPFGMALSQIFNAVPTEEDDPLPPAQKPVYVVNSGDKGLCGGVNAVVSKAVKSAVDADLANGIKPRIFVIGEKGHGALVRTHGQYLVGQIHEPFKTPMNFDKTLIMADRIISACPDADIVKIVYNKFVSAIRYDTEVKETANFPSYIEADDESSSIQPFPLYKYEGELESNEEFLRNLYEYGLAVQLYGCLIDNATAEQSARMTAMDGASKNAGEMVDKLTIRYNRARQAKITTELIEIISGAESLDS